MTHRILQMANIGALAIALSGCATLDLPPVGNPVLAPDIRQGDSWSYIIYNNFRGYEIGTTRLVVESVQPDGVSVQATEAGNATITRYTHDWNPFSGTTPAGNAVTYNPPLAKFQFPLVNNGHWTQTVTATEVNGGLSYPIRIEAWVLGRQKITTPAGEFDTIRISRAIRVGDGASSVFRSDTFTNETEWYAPEVGRSVRYQQDENYYYAKMSSGGISAANQVDWNRVRLELSGSSRLPR
jgi:hypothetical protein